MHALILAAGRGSRMQGLTENCPKAMILVAGRPILEHLIENAVRAGITGFTIHLGYLGSQISDYFGSGETLGTRIIYSDSKFGSPELAVLSLGSTIAGACVCCLCGDMLFSTDQIERLLREHSEFEADATFVLEPADSRDAPRVLVVDGRILGATDSTGAAVIGSNMVVKRAFLEATLATASYGKWETFGDAIELLARDHLIRAIDLGPLVNLNTREEIAAAELRVRLPQR